MKKRAFGSVVFSLVAAIGLLAGCSDSPTGPDGPVPFREIYRGSSNIGGGRQQVIQDPAEWSRVWAEIRPGAPPPVDFARDMVLLAASGQGIVCNEIVIRSVRTEGGRLAVEVDQMVGVNCVCIAVVAPPVHVVSVPRTSASPVFNVRQVPRGC